MIKVDAAAVLIESVGQQRVDRLDYAACAVAHALAGGIAPSAEARPVPQAAQLVTHPVGTGRKVGGRELLDDELRAGQPTRLLDMAASKAVQHPDRVAGVGVEDGVISGLARRPPALDHVADQLSRVGRATDPAVMGVGRGRLTGTALAERLERCALPLGHLSGVRAEPGRTELAVERAKAATRLDRGELTVITGEHDFCSRAL